MQGFYLSLPDSALDQLREIAARGSRPPRDQATILLADAIAPKAGSSRSVRIRGAR